MELNDVLNDPAAFVAAYAERVADLALFSVDFGGLVSGGESWVNASAEEREEGRKILVDATAVAVAVLLGLDREENETEDFPRR